MQHDTSPHETVVEGNRVSVQTASLVLGYSRMRFVQFYLRFTRFECKGFLTDALVHFEGACQRCTIDNTHVVVLVGTGRDSDKLAGATLPVTHWGPPRCSAISAAIAPSDTRASIFRASSYAATSSRLLAPSPTAILGTCWLVPVWASRRPSRSRRFESSNWASHSGKQTRAASPYGQAPRRTEPSTSPARRVDLHVVHVVLIAHSS